VVLLSQVYSTLGLEALNRDLLLMAHWLWLSVTSQVYSTFGLEALNRDLLLMAHWLWSSIFTSEDDQFKTGQTQEGIQ